MKKILESVFCHDSPAAGAILICLVKISIMTIRILGIAALLAVATPVFAQQIDSNDSKVKKTAKKAEHDTKQGYKNTRHDVKKGYKNTKSDVKAGVDGAKENKENR